MLPLRWKPIEAPPTDAAGLNLLLPETDGRALELPDLAAYRSPLQKTVRLLRAAAEVEHALMIQYLYAGYGFSRANTTIISVAMEEMAHLMTVQNLLLLVGGLPHFGRQEYGPPASDEERLFPFDLMLEPVTHESLAKYIVAEAPGGSPRGVDPDLLERIVNAATQGSGRVVERVGSLYALLGVVFGSETLLAQRAASGDPWYVMVNALAAEAASRYGGRDKIHLPDADFKPTSTAFQASERDWDRSVNRSFDEFRVPVVGNREQALDALRDIGLQGEGPSPVALEGAHFERFLNLYREFYGPAGTGTGPARNVSSVPRARQIVVDEQSPDPDAISNPDSALWARLANHRYAILLGALELYLSQPPEDRSFLVGWCFAEMFAIKKLAGILTKKPRSKQVGPDVAAVPFMLPNWIGEPATWASLEADFTASIQLTTAILEQGMADEPQKLLLGHLANSDAHKLEETRARQSRSSARRKPDRAREILDWAAGASDPSHSGDSPAFTNQNQGRFWNLPLDQLKLAEISGAKIVVPGPGGEAPLIFMLRQGGMPRNRPQLDPASPEFKFLREWVEDGCPNDPV